MSSSTGDFDARAGLGPSEPDRSSDDGGSSLFGRGLVYVVVFALPTVVATLVSPLLTRLLGPTEFGKVAFALALLQMLVVLNAIGLDQAVILQRAEDGDDHRARGLIFVSIVVSSITTVALILTSPWWTVPFELGSDRHLVLLTLVWTWAASGTAVAIGLLIGQDRLRVVAVVSILAAAGGQVLGLLLVLGWRPTGLVYVVGTMTAQLCALVIALAASRPRPGGLRDLTTARRAFALGLPISVSAMAGFVLNAGDRLVLQRVLGSSEVGRYQVAYTVGNIAVILLTFTSQAWGPRFASVRDRSERLALVRRTRDDLYRLLIPMLLGVTLVAPLALRLFAPASYDRGPLLLVVFLVAVCSFPVAAGGTTTRELAILRRGRILAIGGVTAAVVNIALNFALIPLLGIAGAAAATVLAMSLQSVLQWWLLPDRSQWPTSTARMWTGIAAACLIGLGSTQLPQSTGWIVARFVVALGCLPWFLSKLVTARTGEPVQWRRLLPGHR